MPAATSRRVVDTNVPLVASERSGMSPECVLTCVAKLQEIMKSGCIVIDDGWLILGEYSHKLSSSGQPKIGDAFFKWLLTNRTNPDRCFRVPLTSRKGSQHDFEEFPSHPGLAQFDPSDRKFVAVAAACPGGPVPILQASDSKWWGWREALSECGIPVEFLCPQEIAHKHAEKIGP